MYEIKIRIHDESDLYNPLDPDQVLLESSVIEYAFRKFQERDHHEECCIHIISDEPVNEQRVKENIHAYIKNEQAIANKAHRLCTLKQARLFIIGLVFLLAWLLAANYADAIMVEVLSIIGSFAIYEAASIWITEKPHLRARKGWLNILEKKTQIRFTLNSNSEENDN